MNQDKQSYAWKMHVRDMRLRVASYFQSEEPLGWSAARVRQHLVNIGAMPGDGAQGRGTPAPCQCTPSEGIDQSISFDLSQYTDKLIDPNPGISFPYDTLQDMYTQTRGRPPCEANRRPSNISNV